RLLDSREQARLGVHVAHERRHRSQVLRWLPDITSMLGQGLELWVGDDHGSLQDDVALGIQPGHLEIYPNQVLRTCLRHVWAPRQAQGGALPAIARARP